MANVNVTAGELLPYEPPTIEDVPIRPDEQVLAGCKTSTSQSPGPTPSNCTFTSCVTPGTS
jgi:hypothetical protein